MEPIGTNGQTLAGEKSSDRYFRGMGLGPIILVGILAILLAVHGYRKSRFYSVRNNSISIKTASSRVKFDPNTANLRELGSIPGLGPSLAQKLVEFRQGKRLAKPGDLLQVPGIGPVTVDKIREWFVWDEIDLSDEYQPAVNVPENSKKQGNLLGNRAGKIKTGDLLLDINTAEIGELIRLPGVGPTLARRVLEERGVKPFSSVDDLMRVPGIGPKTFAKIKPMIKVGSSD